MEGGSKFRSDFRSNAANIGFNASVDTGMNGIHVTLQCESVDSATITWAGFKAGGVPETPRSACLIPRVGRDHVCHLAAALTTRAWHSGSIRSTMQARDSHTSIMGSVGASTIYHSPGDWKPRDNQERARDYAIGLAAPRLQSSSAGTSCSTGLQIGTVSCFASLGLQDLKTRPSYETAGKTTS